MTTLRVETRISLSLSPWDLFCPRKCILRLEKSSNNAVRLWEPALRRLRGRKYGSRSLYALSFVPSPRGIFRHAFHANEAEHWEVSCQRVRLAFVIRSLRDRL